MESFLECVQVIEGGLLGLWPCSYVKIKWICSICENLAGYIIVVSEVFYSEASLSVSGLHTLFIGG